MEETYLHDPIFGVVVGHIVDAGQTQVFNVPSGESLHLYKQQQRGVDAWHAESATL